MAKSNEEQGKLFENPPAWVDMWQGMPEYRQEDLKPWKSINVHFRNNEDYQAFVQLLGQKRKPSANQNSIWYPEAKLGVYRDKRIESITPVMPRYPIFIPSKGRPDTRYTMKSFDRINVPYWVVIEPQERDAYASVIDAKKLIVLPFRDQGLVATRNWIWDYASRIGVPRYWTFDDNIMGLFRHNNNLKTPVADGTFLRSIEDFVERYENVPVAGCNYFMFVDRKSGNIPPITINTRVYSNMLIDTNASDSTGRPFRNEGFYNDDTDLCLRILKDGQCIILFNCFLVDKETTTKVKGGMTPHYQGDGRYKMAKELADKHPDCVTITEKWGRPQHQVNYSAFKKNKLRLKPGVVIPEGVDNYGMTLKILGQENESLPETRNGSGDVLQPGPMESPDRMLGQDKEAVSDREPSPHGGKDSGAIPDLGEQWSDTNGARAIRGCEQTEKPWRERLAKMSIEDRERWGRRVNELEDSGVRFPESERQAFEQMTGAFP